MANKKYKVKNTNLLHNGVVYKSGDTLELDEKQARKLSDFLTCVGTVETKTSKTSAKTKTENTQNETPEVNDNAQ